MSPSLLVMNYDCRVCYRAIYLSVKIYKCVNGHVICDRCSGRLNSCPHCRNHGKLYRDSYMEGILDGLSYDCPHRRNGCMEKLPRLGIKTHETFCLFGSSFEVCRFLGHASTACDFKLTAENAKTVLNHLVHFHPHPSKQIGSEMTVLLNLNHRSGREGYVLRPYADRDSAVLVIVTYTKIGVAFSMVDLSLGLSVEDNIRAVFAVPDDKAPIISWKIALIPGIKSWRFMRKEEGSGAGQFRIAKTSLLQYCNGEGKVRMTVQLK